MFVDRPPAMLTLVTFHDTTPTFTLGSPTSGMLELDDGIARLLGVDRGFYVAVCLAFLQFLEDKQVRLEVEVERRDLHLVDID